MAKIRSYTTIEQSKKLAEILPLESADCYWDYDDLQKYHRINWFEEGFNKESQLMLNENNVCAWSLVALLEEIPEIINFEDDESDYELKIEKENNLYYLSYGNILEYGKLEVEPQEYFVDACVDMIMKLHELKML